MPPHNTWKIETERGEKSSYLERIGWVMGYLSLWIDLSAKQRRRLYMYVLSQRELTERDHNIMRKRVIRRSGGERNTTESQTQKNDGDGRRDERDDKAGGRIKLYIKGPTV